jgi:23S rRNA (adenine2503-C2)-methyltransferase
MIILKLMQFTSFLACVQGMGEPADNADAVLCAANAMADRQQFSLAQSKITISTVAPDSSSFETLGKAPALLAWSVHAVKDSLRQQLVPTTKVCHDLKYCLSSTCSNKACILIIQLKESMDQLRMGLVKALSARSTSMRRTMLEVVLIDGVNDSNEDAELLSEFAQSIMRDVKGSKVVVNLIPFNDIGHPTHRTPSMDKMLGFQHIVIQRSKEHESRPVLCYVRTTRGDEESSACGQLATKKKTKVG